MDRGDLVTARERLEKSRAILEQAAPTEPIWRRYWTDWRRCPNGIGSGESGTVGHPRGGDRRAGRAA